VSCRGASKSAPSSNVSLAIWAPSVTESHASPYGTMLGDAGWKNALHATLPDTDEDAEVRRVVRGVLTSIQERVENRGRAATNDGPTSFSLA